LLIQAASVEAEHVIQQHERRFNQLIGVLLAKRAMTGGEVAAVLGPRW